MSNTDSRYSRQTMLPEIGIEGQLRLESGRVLVIGLGGLGAPAATYLASAGIGRLGLCDLDTVSLSNLQRQVLYTTGDVGKPKTECALSRLQSINPDIEYRLHPQGLTPENAEEIITRYDLVIDCTDNFATRYLIDDVCARLMIPWVHGAIGEFSGQVSVFGLQPTPRHFSFFFPRFLSPKQIY